MTKLSIKNKLYLVILVMLVPMLLVQGYSIVTRFNSVIEYEMEANEDFAKAVGLIFSNYINRIGEDLYVGGMHIAASHHLSVGEINNYLEKYSLQNPKINYIVWSDPGGTILAAIPKMGIGVNFGDRDYYKHIRDGVDLAVSEVLISRISNQPTVAVVRAIRDGNELVGIISASINIAMLDEIMPGERVSSTNSFGLCDDKGIVVYREGYPQIINQMLELNPLGPVRKALDSGQTVRMKKFLSAVTHTYLSGVAVPIPGLGWVAYANSDYGDVITKALTCIKYNLLVLLLATSLSLFIAAKLSSRIMEPISSLQNFAREISDNNLDVRTNIAGNDELAATGAALNEMASRIRQLETSRRLFIQSSAHELRNPLAGIRGIVSLLRRRLADGNAVGDMDKLLAQAEKEVDRLAMIINQLLHTFKEQNHHLDPSAYKWDPVNLAALLREVITAFQMLTEQHDITLELEVEEGLQAAVKGDAARLEDVLRNLLSNAIKYTPGAGEIIVKLQVQGNKALISVRDEGIGIPEEHLHYIFESFFRAENYAGNDPGGMGLGLYISREIVQKHGGRIWAENNREKGSTFYMELPVYDGEES